MPNTVVAQIDDERLAFKVAPSDRFVYSNYYVPLRITFGDDQTPVLPFYKKQELVEVAASGAVSDGRVRQILTDIGLGETWQRNELEQARQRWRIGLQAVQEGEAAARKQAAAHERTRVAPARELRESESMMEMLAARLTGSERELASMVSDRIRAMGRPGAQPQGRRPQGNDVAKRPTVLGSQDAEFIAGLLGPDIGYAFLDRTRITPVSFVIGEHVYALGLAPGEEVVLEQKTFTKRQMTLEEQTEQEKQFDIELASTYTTELQEGMERQRSLSDSWGLSASHTGQYKSPTFFWGQFDASHTIGYTRNVTEANQESYKRSAKDSQTASGKVAARYRTQHKTTFRIVTERGFETTSKRTIKNPNATTPVTLHHFKVLQRLQMKQERYGVRLCWAVSVKDPALTFLAKLAAARQAVIDQALKDLPPVPVEPVAPPQVNDTTTTKRLTQSAVSPITEANKWGATGDMRADYDVDIPVAEGYTWDGNISDDRISIISGRPDNTIGRNIVGTPYMVEGNALRVRVHIGAPSWVGGPGISFQVSVNTYQDVTITDKAGTDTKYADDLAMYRTSLKQWQDNRDSVLGAAQQAADARVAQLLAQLSPVNEMIAQLIERLFPASVRDEMWEIDYWQRLFDWERATYVAYPSWWSGGTVRDPLLDPSDFLNASWSKLYLPIKVGMEKAALRWIFGKSVNVPLPAAVESRFDAVVADLEKYRAEQLGAAGELEDLKEPCQHIKDLHRCIARWEELMPTDGTHIEIVQGKTSVADAITTKELSDAEALRVAILAKQAKSGELADKAKTLMTDAATVQVNIGDPTDQG
jgi:hypothetical protein